MIILPFGHLGYNLCLLMCIHSVRVNCVTNFSLYRSLSSRSSFCFSAFLFCGISISLMDVFLLLLYLQVNGYGIDSMANFFLDFGYTQREELRFPKKKLKALWFSPPTLQVSNGGSGASGPLPRIFISELLVDEMSPQAQVRADIFRVQLIAGLQYCLEHANCF